jgi:hypothetical protein
VKGTVTIPLDPDLERSLRLACKVSGRRASEVVRDALRRQLAVLIFDDLRRQVMPFAERRGYLTDQDIFKAISLRVFLDTNVLMVPVPASQLSC